jgi:hypothetical protein
MKMTEDDRVHAREIFQGESWVCQSGACDAWTEVDVVPCLMRFGVGLPEDARWEIRWSKEG